MQSPSFAVSPPPASIFAATGLLPQNLALIVASPSSQTSTISQAESHRREEYQQYRARSQKRGFTNAGHIKKGLHYRRPFPITHSLYLSLKNREGTLYDSLSLPLRRRRYVKCPSGILIALRRIRQNIALIRQHARHIMAIIEKAVK